MSDVLIYCNVYGIIHLLTATKWLPQKVYFKVALLSMTSGVKFSKKS